MQSLQLTHKMNISQNYVFTKYLLDLAGGYEVRDLFPWEIITKIVMSYLLNVDKKLKLDINKLKPDFELLPELFFRRNNIHREIADSTQNEM